MITITKITGELFLKINYDISKPIKYEEMKILFDNNIIIDSYYMLVNNNKKIYTNLYDIYELKFKNDIILDDMNIIFLPYDKKDVEYIKNNCKNFLLNTIDFPNDNLRNDKLFVLMAVNHSGLYYEKISNELKYDKKIIFNAALSDSYRFRCLDYIPLEYKNDKEFIKFYINMNGSNIRFASVKLIDDEEIVNLAINNDYGFVLQYLNDTYKDNKEFVKKVLNKYPKCFNYISKRLQNDKEIIMLCIKKLNELNEYDNYNNILKLTNYVNRNDKEIVLPLVSMNGEHIKYVSNNLALDKEVVFAAIKNNPLAYHFIDESFFNDKEFILLCLNSNGYDEENYEKFLKILSNEFKDDKDIVIACIKKCCKNIIYCSKRLRNDKEIVLTAINNSYYDFYEKMTENDKIKYIKERTNNIDLILNMTKFKNDPDILKQIIKKLE